MEGHVACELAACLAACCRAWIEYWRQERGTWNVDVERGRGCIRSLYNLSLSVQCTQTRHKSSARHTRECQRSVTEIVVCDNAQPNRKPSGPRTPSHAAHRSPSTVTSKMLYPVYRAIGGGAGDAGTSAPFRPPAAGGPPAAARERARTLRRGGAESPPGGIRQRAGARGRGPGAAAGRGAGVGVHRPISNDIRTLHPCSAGIHATPHRDLAARAFRLGAKHRVYTRRGTSDNSGGAMTKPTRRHHFTLLGRCSRPWTSPPSFSTTQ